MSTFVIMQIGIAVVVVWFIVGAFRRVFGKNGGVSAAGSMVCPSCGVRGQPAMKAKGSMAIEILAWCLFIVPGIFYSLWRLSSKVPACPGCGQAGMIPADSPNGKRLIEASAAAK